MMVDVNQLKMGKLPRKIDQRTLRGADFIDLTKLGLPPDNVDYRQGITDWGMALNDQLGCCTVAASKHLRQVWSKLATGSEVSDADADVLTAYEAVSGYTPGPPAANDNGAVELDVLNYWRQTGVAGEKILAFVSLPVGQQLLLKSAAWLLGGLYIGVEMPLQAQGQIGTLWDVPDPSNPDAAPGSWGGHAVPVVQLDKDGGTVITWAAEQRFTWRWFEAYCTESYGILPPEWRSFIPGAGPGGHSFAELEQIAGQL